MSICSTLVGKSEEKSLGWRKIYVSVKNWWSIKNMFEYDDRSKVNENVGYLDQLNKYRF